MVKKKRKKFCVRVRCLNGRSYQFPLPNDLQKAMWQYKVENPTNWFDLLSQALINIPTKEYRENYQPPMINPFCILPPPNPLNNCLDCTHFCLSRQ